MRPITSIERNDFRHTWEANIFTPLFTPHTAVALSYVHGDAGGLIRSAGGHTVNYAVFTLDPHL
jgi:hypothetical protein